MLRERDGDNCFVCGLPMRFVDGPRLPDNAATLEHKHELREGGSWRHENLALSHRYCNMARSRYSLFVKRWGEQVTRGKWLMPAWPALEGEM